MARTPLFRLLERSLKLARHSLATGRSPAEVSEAWHDAAVSRRALLQGGLAAAGLAAVGCRPLAAPANRAAGEVLIVGAGIAGLTAAHRLRQAGVAARVFDAQTRSGGRMLSLRDHFADGQVCELGGELIDTGHTHIQALAGELGIELDDLTTDEALPEVWYFDGAARSEAEIIEAFQPIAAAIDRDLEALGDGDITYQTSQGAEALDRMTLREWLDRAGASGWFRKLIDVGYTTEYGLETDRQSALNLLLMIDTSTDHFKIFGESDERFHVRGGNDRITTALADGLRDQLELGAVLEAVRQRADGAYVCTLRRAGASFEAVGSHLLLAIPFTLLREVKLDLELPAVKRRAIAELGYGTNAKLMVGFSSRPWRTLHGSNGSVLSDLPFQLTWETSRLQPGNAGILTNFTGGAHGVELGAGTAAEQAQKLVAELERVLPGVASARAGMRETRFHWPSHPWTRGSYASYLPGQWTGIAGAEGETVGRLYFAGEHCSLAAQGFMEGGCETGEAAAGAILADLRVRRAA